MERLTSAETPASLLASAPLGNYYKCAFSAPAPALLIQKLRLGPTRYRCQCGPEMQRIPFWLLLFPQRNRRDVSQEGGLGKGSWRQEETGKAYPTAVIRDTERVHGLGVQLGACEHQVTTQGRVSTWRRSV